MRSLNDWEEDIICNLLALLVDKEVLLAKVMMRLCGRLTLRGLLPSRVFVPQSLECWKVGAKSIGKSKAPTKVSFLGGHKRQDSYGRHA